MTVSQKQAAVHKALRRENLPPDYQKTLQIGHNPK
jgi:hypothetical protein